MTAADGFTGRPLTRFVPFESLESYRARFAEHAALERNDGVLEVRFHTQGGPVLWSFEFHRALSQLFMTIGQDPQNEIIILTGTGEYWTGGRDVESFYAVEHDTEQHRQGTYEYWFLDSLRLQESLLWNIHVPTIGVVNGPGAHLEIAMLCDLTIATDDVRVNDAHFRGNSVPGDGLFIVLQHLLGLKRANHLMWLAGEGISSEDALELGLFNEVISNRDQLMPRARAMAAELMKQDRIVRRMTTMIARRTWRRVFENDFLAHIASESWCVAVKPEPHYNY